MMLLTITTILAAIPAEVVAYRGSHDGGRSRGGGHGKFADVRCQVCHKLGHEASFCYHRYDENYVPSQPMNYTNSTSPSQTSQSQNQTPLPKPKPHSGILLLHHPLINLNSVPIHNHNPLPHSLIHLNTCVKYMLLFFVLLS